ncbi:MAG: ABC-2 family transporter protein [Filifactoraceae bacterium]
MDFKSYLGTYFIYAKNDIKSQLNYPLDFFIQFIIWTIYTIIPFMGLWIIFSKFGNIGEWSLYHVALMYSIIGFSYDLSRMIGRGFDDFHKLLIRGELDIFLIRPSSLFIQILGSKLFLRRLSGIVNYGVIMLISTNIIFDGSNLSWIYITLMIFIVCLSTTAIFLGLLMIYATLCIFTIKKNYFSDLFVDMVSKVSYFPIDYLDGSLKYILIYIVPIYFSTYVPIKNLIFKDNYKEAIISVFLSLIIGCSFLILTKLLFNTSLKYYRSCNN